MIRKELEEILIQKKSTKNLRIRQKYQSNKSDPSTTFYRALSENKKKRIIDNLEVYMEDGTTKELTKPSEIAGHLSSIYAKLFNGNK